ncbi:hypothetical protein D039_0033A, partial [Vibrio parahaemolyticus EKP-028]
MQIWTYRNKSGGYTGS